MICESCKPVSWKKPIMWFVLWVVVVASIIGLMTHYINPILKVVDAVAIAATTPDEVDDSRVEQARIRELAAECRATPGCDDVYPTTGRESRLLIIAMAGVMLYAGYKIWQSRRRSSP